MRVVAGGAEDGFFEEDESPEAVARLAAHFGGPRRYVRDELTEVVRTLRRQSERKVREEIVTDLKDRLEQLLGRAMKAEAEWGFWKREWLPGEHDLLPSSPLAGRIDEAAHCLWIVCGSPYLGSTINHVAWVEAPGHRVEVVSVPQSSGNRFTAVCKTDGMKIQRWSPTIMGAKRLARRHAGLM